MSSFRSAAFDPVSGTVREAYWIDDHFGKHRYGVRFDDGGPVYDPKDVELRAAGAEITRLRSLTAELVEALEHTANALMRVTDGLDDVRAVSDWSEPTDRSARDLITAARAIEQGARATLSRARAKEDT